MTTLTCTTSKPVSRSLIQKAAIAIFCAAAALAPPVFAEKHKISGSAREVSEPARTVP